MATDQWVKFGDTELINLSRTAQLAQSLGIDTVWTDPASVQWVQDALGEADYDVPTEAPWYDPGYPASAEFAGVVPLSVPQLDDSTREAVTIEYNTDGGSSGRGRNRTLSIVFSVAIVASTPRGADFGKRWLDRVLSGGQGDCSGVELRYFRWAQQPGGAVPDQAHRRDVTLSRGSSVTRKRTADCSATWLVTFTLTANDPFEYGDLVPVLADLGDTVTAPSLLDSGSLAMVEQPCPGFDYTPLYDPLFPALVPSPTAPSMYPDGWDFVPGVTFDRSWARVGATEPTTSNMVPVVTLGTDVTARMVRVSIWPSSAGATSTCTPLWTATVSYLPDDVDFVIDGEQGAVYAITEGSGVIRRADSLVYGVNAGPVEWAAFNDPDNLLVTLDVMAGSDSGAGTVTAALALVPKSD